MSLRYHGTDREVRFGDRVVIRRWFRAPRRGVVCHIHGGMSSMPELEAAGTPLWSIRDTEGELHHFVLEPKPGVAPRSVRLVARAGEPDQPVRAAIPQHTPAC